MLVRLVKLGFFLQIVLLFACNYNRENLPVNEPLSWKFNDTIQIGDWEHALNNGSVYRSLINNLFLQKNLYKKGYLWKIGWISHRPWLYKATFMYRDQLKKREVVELVLDGLDTYAQIYVNGTFVGQTNDYYKSYEFNITPYLENGKNEILIKFLPAETEAKRFYKNLNYSVPSGYLSVVRKPYFHLVDEYSVNYNPIGFVRRAYIRAWEKAKIKSFQVYTDQLDSTQARLRAKLLVKSTGSYTAELELESQFKPILSKKVKLEPGLNRIEFKFKIDSPQLWYPIGYGKQNMYKFTLTLKVNNAVYDRQAIRMGLRNVRIDTSGHRIRVWVNDKPIKVRAVELLPFAVEPAQEEMIAEEMIRVLLNANVNTLVMWDKGFYHPQEFYDLCDQRGLLVIQNFMLPVKVLPPKDTIVKLLMDELQHTIMELRLHPSIIAWSANYNDSVVNAKLMRYPKPKRTELRRFSNLLFKAVIPKLVKDNDSGRTYLPGLFYKNVWYSPLERVSISSPEKIKSVIGSESPLLHKDLLERYVKPSGRLFSQLEEVSRKFGVDSLLNISYFSQLEQAKVFISSLYQAILNPQYDFYIIRWFNDITPVTISPSAIGSSLALKAKYFYIRRAFDDFIIINQMKEQYITSTIYSAYDTASLLTYYKLYDLRGELLWQKINTERLVNHRLTQTFDMGVYFKLFSRDTLIFKVETYYNLNLEAEQYLYLKRQVEKIDFQDPKLSVNLYPIDVGYAIEITPEAFLAKDVYIKPSKHRFILSNSFFDILPGENKISVLYSKFQVQDLQQYIQIYSYYDMLTNRRLNPKESRSNVKYRQGQEYGLQITR